MGTSFGHKTSAVWHVSFVGGWGTFDFPLGEISFTSVISSSFRSPSYSTILNSSSGLENNASKTFTLRRVSNRPVSKSKTSTLASLFTDDSSCQTQMIEVKFEKLADGQKVVVAVDWFSLRKKMKRIF